MDDKRQVQKELFEEFVETGRKRPLKGSIHPGIKKSFNLSYEHLVFIAIAFLIGCVVSYALGVERGKASSLPAKDIGKAEDVRPEPVQDGIKAASKESPAPEATEAIKETDAKHKAAADSPQPVYTVRVASYLKESTAERESDLLKMKGLDSFVYKSGRYYVVCVGRYKDKAAADVERRKLLKTYPDCYVKKQ